MAVGWFAAACAMISGRHRTADRRLDLQDQPELAPVGAQCRERLLQPADVPRRLHERILDAVRMTGHELEIREVLLAQDRHVESRVGEVERLLALELRAADRRAQDAREQSPGGLALDDELELAVVVIAVIADHGRVDRRGKRAFRGGAAGLHDGVLERTGRGDDERVAAIDAMIIARQADGPGPDLGSRDVHHHPQPVSRQRLGDLDVVEHALPRLRVVVRAVDADRIDPPMGEAEEEVRVVRGLGRAGHEQAREGPVDAASEEVGATSREEGLALEERVDARSRAFRFPRQRRDGCPNRPEPGHHATLDATEGGQPEEHQGALQVTEIAPSKRDVGGEILRARGDVALGGGPVGLDRIRVAADVGDQPVEFGEQGSCVRSFGGGGHGADGRWGLRPRHDEERGSRRRDVDPGTSIGQSACCAIRDRVVPAAGIEPAT